VFSLFCFIHSTFLYIFGYYPCISLSILSLYISSVHSPACSPLESLSSSDDEEVQRITAPKVILQVGDSDEQERQSPENLPPVLRRAKFRKAASSSPAGSPKITSPEPSPGVSPRTTPRGSPVNSPRGVRKFIKRGKVSLCTQWHGPVYKNHAICEEITIIIIYLMWVLYMHSTPMYATCTHPYPYRHVNTA
jgi:hypothetical protein